MRFYKRLVNEPGTAHQFEQPVRSRQSEKQTSGLPEKVANP